MNLFDDRPEVGARPSDNWVHPKCGEPFPNCFCDEDKTCECGCCIWFVKAGPKKSLCPVESDGTPHWASCPHAADYRKGRPS